LALLNFRSGYETFTAMIRRKGKKDSLGQDVASANRFGCGCITLFFFGIVVAMIVSGFMALRH
jgi:hypothetical protein